MGRRHARGNPRVISGREPGQRRPAEGVAGARRVHLLDLRGGDVDRVVAEDDTGPARPPGDEDRAPRRDRHAVERPEEEAGLLRIAEEVVGCLHHPRDDLPVRTDPGCVRPAPHAHARSGQPPREPQLQLRVEQRHDVGEGPRSRVGDVAVADVPLGTAHRLAIDGPAIGEVLDLEVGERRGRHRRPPPVQEAVRGFEFRRHGVGTRRDDRDVGPGPLRRERGVESRASGGPHGAAAEVQEVQGGAPDHEEPWPGAHAAGVSRPVRPS